MTDLLTELKLKRPRTWMMITNGQGALVHRSLLKVCEKEGLQAGPENELLQALLDLPSLDGKGGYTGTKARGIQPAVLDDKFIHDEFQRLCSFHGVVRLSYEQCLSWDWVASQVGVSITDDAVRELWGLRVASSDVSEIEFGAFARALREESGFATTIQSFLRGRAGRQKAHSQAMEENRTAQESRCAAAMKLAPYNPTPSCAIHQALEALGVGSGDLLYDLGCGDGRLLIAAAQRGARAVGVEYDARFVEKALSAIKESGLSDLAYVTCGDAFLTDLTPASKIFLYLVPDGLRKLEPSLCAAIKRGTPIASYMFSIPGWSFDDVLTAESRSPECKVWIYKHPSCLPALPAGQACS